MLRFRPHQAANAGAALGTTPGALRDRLHLIRQATETLFGGRPSFDAGWTVTAVSGTNHDGTHTLDLGELWASFDTLLWYARPFTVTPAPIGSDDPGGDPPPPQPPPPPPPHPAPQPPDVPRANS